MSKKISQLGIPTLPLSGGDLFEMEQLGDSIQVSLDELLTNNINLGDLPNVNTSGETSNSLLVSDGTNWNASHLVSTNILLAGNSDLNIPSEKAVKTYVDDSFKDMLKIKSYTLPLALVTDNQVPLAGTFRTVNAAESGDVSTDWAVANQHVFILVNTIVTGGQMIITGTALSESTAIPVTDSTEVINIDTTGNQYYQTIKKWWEITNIDITSGAIAGIDYDYGVIGYPDFGNVDFKIVGYRLDAFAQNINADFSLKIWKVQDDGNKKASIIQLEDIGVDSGSGSDQIIDDLRTGAFDRSYDPSVTLLWDNNTTITLKQLDFDAYFTNNENNILSSVRDEGYIIAIEGSPSGGITAVDYITILLYYKLL